jgi:hypothetical protein
VIALLDLGTRELHLPSEVHAVALCGEPMRGNFTAGPLGHLHERADHVCAVCFDLVDT